MSDQKPVYAIVQMDVTDPERFLPEYAMPLIGQFMERGIQPLAATPEPDVIEGSYDRSNTVIIKLPDRAAFDDWYNSDDYAPLKAKRAELSDQARTVMLVLPEFGIPA